jgi:hypothetical protein
MRLYAKVLDILFELEECSFIHDISSLSVLINVNLLASAYALIN